MAVAGPAHVTRVEVERVPPPAPAVLAAVALGALAAAAVAIALAVTSDHVDARGVQAALMVWVVLAYVLAGVAAWWRRPESRIGPLMAAVGFTIFLSSLSWANAPLPFTVGIAFDLLPVVLFLHVFLSFPGGRLEDGVERALVALGYVTALGLQLVGLALGGFGPTTRSPWSPRRRPRTRCCASSSWCSAPARWPGPRSSSCAGAGPGGRCGARSRC